MLTNNSNSSLTVSCSLSLLLIGLFMYIDQGKEDKSNVLKSNHFFKTEKISLEQRCTTETVWTQGQHVTSEAINFYADNDTITLEPELHENISRISECIEDKNLTIYTTKDNLGTSDESDRALSLLIHKYFVIRSALEEKHVQPREFRLAVALGKKRNTP
jgi:hypothetical protein